MHIYMYMYRIVESWIYYTTYSVTSDKSEHTNHILPSASPNYCKRNDIVIRRFQCNLSRDFSRIHFKIRSNGRSHPCCRTFQFNSQLSGNNAIHHAILSTIWQIYLRSRDAQTVFNNLITTYPSWHHWYDRDSTKWRHTGKEETIQWYVGFMSRGTFAGLEIHRNLIVTKFRVYMSSTSFVWF